MSDDTPNYIELAADIVSAFVSNNSVPIADLPSLIGNVHSALQNAGQPNQEEAKPTPAVSIRKSITPDYLISLEDGKQYKSLKRHLTKLRLTPEAYREKWDLPRDYPMVAATYAAKRSEMAKSIGLGQMRSKAAQAKAAANDAVTTAPAKATAKRGRKKAAA
ncbi:MucR family transcriptional regulator (plasmid) [Microvirga ossetica]|uniref:MucR family transcriptional regulator n=1 Tax=Microvirga ossetica TaxID=1882682 RepID=A0A1B2EZ01_9HYPH|nr:MucR family transcriptional regulator [Microvirga ossetica]ANY85219.1 MucR family transcriptional regulator [Microvirga ossetica]